MKYILASASPRRRELLRLITEDFTVKVPEKEENCPAELALSERPEFLARQKAQEIAEKERDSLIIAADTAVFCDGKMFGKPKNECEAKAMLSSLSGRTHTVITGCCVLYSGKEKSFSVSTGVKFYSLTENEIEEYIKTGESADKAGAYGIQGKGALLVEKIYGDYYNVVGLPVAELGRQIRRIVR